MKKDNIQTGKLGEKLARDFLVKKSFQIEAANFRTRFGEIDLIANRGQQLVFVEVKLKIGDRFGSPEEMINPTKIAKVRKMATVFLQKNPRLKTQYPKHQIDAVCIVLNPDQSVSRINHWENIGNEMD